MTARDLPGVKEAELIRLGPCRICGEHLLATPEPTFYVVRLSRAMKDHNALRRRLGLELQLGALGSVFSPDEDLAKVFDGPQDCAVHESCAHGIGSLLQLMAAAEPAPEAEEVE